MGEVAESVQSVKECLRMDNDDKDCKAWFKSIKKIDKALNSIKASAQRNRWREVIESAKDITATIEQGEMKSELLFLNLIKPLCKAYGEVSISWFSNYS